MSELKEYKITTTLVCIVEAENKEQAQEELKKKRKRLEDEARERMQTAAKARFKQDDFWKKTF